MVIERLLRTVEKGTCDVGSRRRVLASGPAMGTRHRVLLWGPSVGSCFGVPLSGPHGKPRRHGTISGRDADSRRLPTTLRGVVPATAASRTAAAQRVRSSNALGRYARPHNATRCGSETSLCAPDYSAARVAEGSSPVGGYQLMMLWKGGGVRDREQPDGCSGAALPPPTGAGSTVAGGAAGGVGPWRWRTGVRLAKLVPDYRRRFLFSIRGWRREL